MASVTFKAIAKHFPGGEAAVSDLSLDIASGEFLVLLGPSGCGKSTALRLLAGLEDPTSGDIMIDGLRVNDLPAGGRELGMVFQSYALYPHMTVRENLTFGLRNGPRKSRLDGAEIERRADEAIDLLDLGALTERLPKELSGGSSSGWQSDARSQSDQGAVNGRALVEFGCEVTQSHALRTASSARTARYNHGLCHTRSGRGDDLGRPYGSTQCREVAASRHAA